MFAERGIPRPYLLKCAIFIWARNYGVVTVSKWNGVVHVQLSLFHLVGRVDDGNLDDILDFMYPVDRLNQLIRVYNKKSLHMSPLPNDI